jgi:hypothetical protein
MEGLGKPIDDQNISLLDETLMKALMGSKNNPGVGDPINVLTMVDRVEKAIRDSGTIGS